MSQFDLFNSGPLNHTSLDELFAEMMRMSDDPLANAGTNVVISRGNLKAKLLIVGEAPSPQENVQGKPFVGLDKVLQATEFDPERDAYIANSVFCMPSGEDKNTFRSPHRYVQHSPSNICRSIA